MARFLLIILTLLALPLRAERVRVVVAVDPAEVSVARVGGLRAEVMRELRAATRVQPWGNSSVFSAEIDASDLERLRRDPRVQAVTLDQGGGGHLTQSIPIVGGDVARAAGYDGRGVTIAILDSGIDLTHPDFAGRIVGEQCFCESWTGGGCCPNGQTTQSGPGSARDEAGHGTHVAGIAAGGGVDSPAGLAPAANIVAVRVMDADNTFSSFTQVWQGLDWIERNRPDVRVINMSLGTFALFGNAQCESTAIGIGVDEVVRKLRARGVMITVSSGNSASITGLGLPACMRDVLTVGATYDAALPYTSNVCTDTTAAVDQIVCFTNSTNRVDIVAPGARITASRLGGGEATFVGTSMAAPHVAGAIALMVQKNPLLTANNIEQFLELGGKLVTDARNKLIFPRLDVAAAIAATPPPDPSGPRRRSIRH